MVSFHHRNRWSKSRRNEALAGYLFLVPSIVGYLSFTLIPIVFSFGLSFFNWRVFGKAQFVGFNNYQNLVIDPLFWESLGNTLYYVGAYLFLGTTCSLILALLVNRTMRGIWFFKMVYFLPVVTSLVAVSLVWQWLYDIRYGFINVALIWIGLEPSKWLGGRNTAMPAIIIMSVWHQAGYGMLLFLAGLQGIPHQLYESARIDGANWWQQFRHITFPLLSPTTFFVLTVSTISSFQIFDQVYVLTQGGPANATLTIVYYLYQNAFSWLDFGYASSIAWSLFILVFGVTLVQWKLSKKWVFYK